jgi:hypothetical protein
MSSFGNVDITGYVVPDGDRWKFTPEKPTRS